ncbi:PAF acetylhydrolase [Hypoxylon sp. FL1150]|nr:PAF acetylhydrolase [Hypoxylon sp. FL1150]
MKPFPEAPAMEKPPATGPKTPAPAVFCRRRLRWRYVLGAATAIYVLYRYAFSLPLLARPLPPYSGPYAVGAVDIEVPVAEPRVIDGAVFKDTEENAFELESVLFTLYYPTTTTPDVDTRPKSKHHHHHYWVPQPISATGRGYAKFAGIDGFFFLDKVVTAGLWALVGGIEIPAVVDAPLADLAAAVSAAVEEEEEEDMTEVRKVVHIQKRGHPVVVFSHGMASRRADYSHYAGELASRGYVVAVLEHRDGSSPGSVVLTRPGDREDRVRLMFDAPEVQTTAKPGARTLTVDEFKRAQLEYREAEMEEAVRVLRRINEGDGSAVRKENARGEGSDLASWKGRLNTEEMVVAGHSYGATGAMQALRGGPSVERPFRGAVILDPGKASGRLNDDVRVPVLVVHSNSWSAKRSVFYGRPHFDTVFDIVENNVLRGVPSWFATSLGTAHPSVTDAPLLEPLLLSWTTGARIDVDEGLRQYVHVTEDFLWFLTTGEKRSLLAEKAEFPQYDEGSGFGMWKPGQNGSVDVEGPWDDWRKYWQVHISPN